MRALVTAVYLFLYTPIALVVLFSFNAGRNASDFTGFSTQWYGKALANTFLMEALQNSLTIAFTSAGLAAIFGTMAAIGMERLGAGRERSSMGCSLRRSSFPASSSALRRWWRWSRSSASSIH